MISLKRKNKNDPRVTAMRESILAVGRAHGECEDLFDKNPLALRDGAISACWVGDVLVVTATGEHADDLKTLLDAALLADPEFAA